MINKEIEKNEFEKTQPDKNLKINMLDSNNEKNIHRKDIKSGFLLENFFSKEECYHYCQQIEKLGLKSVEKEYPKNYRNAERLCLFSDEVATLIWRRLLPFLKREDIHDKRPLDFNNEGIWRPVRVNECLKFTKYKKDSFFKPHLDGLYVPLQNEATIHTILIYLNDEFEGGNTNFVKIPKDKNLLSFLKDPEGDYDVLESVSPSIGSALIFNSDQCHEGEVLTKGTKYVLKTEIIFQRTNNDQIDFQFNKIKEYEKMWEYYNLVIKSLIDKESSEVVSEYYLKAIDLQYQYVKNKKYPSQDIPQEIVLLICQYLKIPDMLNLKLVNKNWNYIIIQAFFWEKWMKKEYKINYDIHLREFDGNPDLGDWYQIYKKSFILEKKNPLIIKFDDTIRYILDIDPFYSYVEEKPSKYEINIYPGWAGMEIMVLMTNHCTENFFQNGVMIPTQHSKTLLQYLFDNILNVYSSRPLIIPTPPFVYADSESILQEDLQRIGFLPYSIFFVDSTLLLLYNSRKSSGIVIYKPYDSSPTCFTIIIDYKIVEQRLRYPKTKIEDNIKDLLTKVDKKYHQELKNNMIMFNKDSDPNDELQGAALFVGTDQYVEMRQKLKKKYKNSLKNSEITTLDLDYSLIKEE